MLTTIPYIIDERSLRSYEYNIYVFAVRKSIIISSCVSNRASLPGPSRFHRPSGGVRQQGPPPDLWGGGLPGGRGLVRAGHHRAAHTVVISARGESVRNGEMFGEFKSTWLIPASYR